MKLGLDPRRTERSAHSLYLEVLAEQGIFGFLMFAFVLYSAFASLSKARRIFNKVSMNSYADLALAFQIGFVGYLTSALFIHGAYPRNLWLLIGVGFAAQQAASSEELNVMRALFRKRLEIGEASLAQKPGKMN
jgi:O-antigen ligase